jgi:UDP-glucose:(heptosyl)LPS alpha-1,3-glucosyltransferase
VRVALIYKRYALNGGSERQLSMLARDLAERGHEVHVFCRSVRADPPPGVVLHVMPAMPLTGVGALFAFSRWARWACARFERRDGRFDVRHAYGRTLGQDVYRVGGGCHRTYLEHAHAIDRPAWWRRWARRAPGQLLKANLEERALRNEPTPWVITNSGMVRNDLLFRYDLAPEQVTVVHNGVDLDRFRPPGHGERDATRAEWGVDPEDEVVLFLGTGYARKGLEPTLRAVRLLADKREAVRLVVAGRDGRQRFWQALAQRLGIASRIIWVGPTSRPEACYHGADVYALPTAYDPAANSTLEALATGLPVVTSAMNGAAEILDDGVHGSVLSCPVHPVDMAAALASWLERRREPGLAACNRERAERYPAGQSCEQILDVYRAMLDHRCRP